MDFNNAAGRLYILLDGLRKTSKHASIQEAWATIFSVPGDDLDQLIILNAETIKLMENVKNLILKQDVGHDLYLKPFIKIQRVFTLSLGHQVQNALEFLDEATMTGLEHCVELLSRTAKENPIEEAILQELLNDIGNLEKSFLESSINEELKIMILENLLEIKKAIHYYRIHGARGIEKAVKNTLGSVQYFTLNNSTIEIKNHKDEQAILNYISFIENILSIISIGLNIPSLTSNISSFLLGAGK